MCVCARAIGGVCVCMCVCVSVSVRVCVGHPGDIFGGGGHGEERREGKNINRTHLGCGSVADGTLPFSDANRIKSRVQRSLHHTPPPGTYRDNFSDVDSS